MEDLCREATDPIVPPGYGAVVVTELPEEGIENLVYIVDDGESLTPYVWNGEEYASIGGCVFTEDDEGKVVSNGALVSQTSDTVTDNGTYDTTTKNEVVVDVQSGGGGPVLLASETATEDVNVMTISYDSATMSGYTYFEMEIEGVAQSEKLLYPCPQINTTSSKVYNGYVQVNEAFHFYAPVVPYYSGNSHNIQGYRVSIGEGSTQQAVDGNTISSFSYVSFYPEGGFQSGTVFKVWGIA